MKTREAGISCKASGAKGLCQPWRPDTSGTGTICAVLGASVKYPQPSLKVRPFSEICYFNFSAKLCKVLVRFTQIIYTLMLFRYGMVTKA